MISYTKIVSIEVDGWEVEFEIPFEFSVNPGYPGSWDEPPEPAHIEEIVFEDEAVKKIVRNEITDVELAEGTVIKFDMQEVLDDIQADMDDYDLLHEELLNHAYDLANEKDY